MVGKTLLTSLKVHLQELKLLRTLKKMVILPSSISLLPSAFFPHPSAFFHQLSSLIHQPSSLSLQPSSIKMNAIKNIRNVRECSYVLPLLYVSVYLCGNVASQYGTVAHTELDSGTKRVVGTDDHSILVYGVGRGHVL